LRVNLHTIVVDVESQLSAR